MNRILLSLSLLLSFSLQVSAQRLIPTELASMPEAVANNAVAAATVSGVSHVYSFGGIDTSKIYSGIHLRSFRYNTQTDIWDTIAPLPDTLGKIAAGASTVKNIIYIIGGYHVFASGNELSSGKVHRYDPENNVYLTDGADIPVAIDDQVQAVYNDSLIFVVTGWSNTTNVPDVQIYNPALDVWSVGTPVPDNGSYKSFGASGTIIGDTLYYFGGARIGFNFPIQPNFRKGYINPADPTQITWSQSVPNVNFVGYRMAATSTNGYVCWVGGANQTYNFNGLAYSNGNGVDPNNRNIYFKPDKGWGLDFSFNYPMDLRGVAEVSDAIKYITGGMLENQVVSNKLYRLNAGAISVQENVLEDLIMVYPNPVIDNFIIDASDFEGFVEVIIIDVNGKEVMRVSFEGEELIDFSAYPMGMYLLSISTEEDTYYTSVIKK